MNNLKLPCPTFLIQSITINYNLILYFKYFKEINRSLNFTPNIFINV